MRARGPNPESGQSMVETVVVLFVVLLLFLGLWYFKGVVDTRMEAVEAARYMVWETVWNARPNPSQPGLRATIAADLPRFRLHGNLVFADPIGRKKLSDYASSVNGEPVFVGIPQFIENFFKNPERRATDSSQSSPGSGTLPSFNQVSGPIQTIFNVADFTFGLNDIIAGMTNWQQEADQSVATVRVRYRVPSRGLFAFVGDIPIDQTAAILGHPYLVERTNDQTEYDRVFGTGTIGSCITGGPGKGHIFGLWGVPSVPVPGVSIAIDSVKCILSEVGNIMSIADIIPGGALGFKSPDGTLKEFPELHL